MATLSSELKKLVDIGGGALNGANWQDTCQATTYKELSEQTTDTLMKVNKVAHIAMIRSVSQAMKIHEQRHQIFSEEVDADLSGEVAKQIKRARVTLVEYFFATALRNAVTNLELGQQEIQKHTLTLEPAKILSTDLHPVLWKTAQLVLKGKAPA